MIHFVPADLVVTPSCPVIAVSFAEVKMRKSGEVVVNNSGLQCKSAGHYGTF